jgi:hypothetical protein
MRPLTRLPVLGMVLRLGCRPAPGPEDRIIHEIDRLGGHLLVMLAAAPRGPGSSRGRPAAAPRGPGPSPSPTGSRQAPPAAAGSPVNTANPLSNVPRLRLRDLVTPVGKDGAPDPTHVTVESQVTN